MRGWPKRGIFLACVVVTLWVGTTRGWAQQESPSKPVSVGAQAARVVLKHYALNPFALDPKTSQPLPSNGNWSIGKTTPASCPQIGPPCVEVFYDVPAESVRCSWVVLLNADGADGAFLDENDDAERYLMRVVSKTEALALVSTRKNPVYPPIAIAAKVTGEVVVEAVVGKSGDVQKTLVVSGPPMLTMAASQAAQSWKFKPMMVGTRAVPCEVKLVFSFKNFVYPSASGDLAP